MHVTYLFSHSSYLSRSDIAVVTVPCIGAIHLGCWNGVYDDVFAWAPSASYPLLLVQNSDDEPESSPTGRSFGVQVDFPWGFRRFRDLWIQGLRCRLGTSTLWGYRGVGELLKTGDLSDRLLWGPLESQHAASAS